MVGIGGGSGGYWGLGSSLSTVSRLDEPGKISVSLFVYPSESAKVQVDGALGSGCVLGMSLPLGNLVYAAWATTCGVGREYLTIPERTRVVGR